MPVSGASLRRDAPGDVALVALVALVFGKAAWFPFVNWDDPSLVLDNPLVRAPLSDGLLGLLGTARIGYPEPLTVLSQYLDFRVGGGAPWAFHVTNLLIHAVNVLLVRRLATSVGLGRIGAYAAAALFAVHPLVAEPVCWVTGRKDLLVALGLLIATLTHRRLLHAGTTAIDRVGLAIGALVAFGSKPTGWALPALLASDWLGQRRRPPRAVVALLGGSAVVVGVAASIAYREHRRLGGLVRGRTVAESVRFALQHFTLQLRDVFFPTGLSAVYREGFPLPWTSAWGIASAAVVIAFATLLFFQFRARPSPSFFGLSWCLLTFVPASGLVAMRRGPADSYFYVPLIGVLIAIAPLAERAIRVRSRVAVTLTAAGVVVFGALGFIQADVWRTSMNLWRPVVALYPKDPYANEMMARASFLESWPLEGVAYYEKSILLSPYPPRDPHPLSALGFACFKLREWPCAAKWYGEVVRHYPRDTGNALRFLSVYLRAPLPEYRVEAEAAKATAAATLRELASLPDRTRDARAHALFRATLAEDRVPVGALQLFAERSDLKPAALTLLRLYAATPR